MSGSFPPGTDPELVRRLTRLAHEAGLRVVLDVSGAHLSRALGLRPDLVKPNRVEAAQTLTGLGRGEVPSVPGAARALVAAGARAAIVSDGTNGLVLVHDDVALRAYLPRSLSGNPTGAGDALTAALAADLDGDRRPADGPGGLGRGAAPRCRVVGGRRAATRRRRRRPRRRRPSAPHRRDRGDPSVTRSALTPVLAEAVAAGRAVAAFNVIQLEHAEAYAAAAERVGLPVVMQISENCVRYHGSLAPIAAATLAIADACSNPSSCTSTTPRTSRSSRRRSGSA